MQVEAARPTKAGAREVRTRRAARVASIASSAIAEQELRQRGARRMSRVRTVALGVPGYQALLDCFSRLLGLFCTVPLFPPCAPRRACERRAADAGWQVALAATKFAGYILDWTLVS